MQIARILYPVEVLGPGKRIAIWVCGCKRRCPHCANPELQAFDPGKDIPVYRIMEMIRELAEHYPVDGITVSGGEPFEQARDCRELLEGVHERIPDILLFTGYTIEELHALRSRDVEQVLENTAVLVDGEYIEEENHGSVLRGSDNQRVHIFNRELEQSYQEYISGQRQYQNFAAPSGIYGIGLHKPGFIDELQERLGEQNNAVGTKC